MYKYFNPNYRNKSAGDCVIRAICAAEGKDWDTVYDELCFEGKYGGDWASNNDIWDNYLMERGYKKGLVPTAPEGISLSFFVDGAEDPSSRMISVPTAVETYDNVGAEIIVTVPYMCTCSSFSVVNTSTIPIAVQNANLVISA